jgi:hypothetical protein
VNAEELAEILSDFPSFCSLLEIKTKSGGLTKFSWERWHGEQRKFEQTRSGRDITIKGRQIGFTTMELARDLHHAITRPGENVQVVVHDEKLKDQLFLSLRTMAMGLKGMGLLPATLYSTKTELVFKDLDSAVRIVESGATSGSAQKKGRSGTIHRLHATEMAFWGAAADTWTALAAAVPDTAEVIIESTANGAGGLFYEMVQAARFQRGGYKLHFFPWFEHQSYRAPIHDRDRESFDPTPRDKWEQKLREAGCDDQQIRWWRFKVDAPEWGVDRTLQEFPIDADSCFRVAGRSYFEPEVIDRLNDQCREPKSFAPLKWADPQTGAVRHLGDLKVWVPYDAKSKYVIGGDVSEGTGSDAYDYRRGHSADGCDVLV